MDYRIRKAANGYVVTEERGNDMRMGKFYVAETTEKLAILIVNLYDVKARLKGREVYGQVPKGMTEAMKAQKELNNIANKIPKGVEDERD